MTRLRHCVFKKILLLLVPRRAVWCDQGHVMPTEFETSKKSQANRKPNQTNQTNQTDLHRQAQRLALLFARPAPEAAGFVGANLVLNTFVGKPWDC